MMPIIDSAQVVRYKDCKMNAELIKALKDVELYIDYVAPKCYAAIESERVIRAAADALEAAYKRIEKLEAQMQKGEIVPCHDCKYRALSSIGICWNKKLVCVGGKRKE